MSHYKNALLKLRKSLSKLATQIGEVLEKNEATIAQEEKEVILRKRNRDEESSEEEQGQEEEEEEQLHLPPKAAKEVAPKAAKEVAPKATATATESPKKRARAEKAPEIFTCEGSAYNRKNPQPCPYLAQNSKTPVLKKKLLVLYEGEDAIKTFIVCPACQTQYQKDKKAKKFAGMIATQSKPKKDKN
jgi:hypothetical protein